MTAREKAVVLWTKAATAEDQGAALSQGCRQPWKLKEAKEGLSWDPAEGSGLVTP